MNNGCPTCIFCPSKGRRLRGISFPSWLIHLLPSTASWYPILHQHSLNLRSYPIQTNPTHQTGPKSIVYKQIVWWDSPTWSNTIPGGAFLNKRIQPPSSLSPIGSSSCKWIRGSLTISKFFPIISSKIFCACQQSFLPSVSIQLNSHLFIPQNAYFTIKLVKKN